MKFKILILVIGLAVGYVTAFVIQNITNNCLTKEYSLVVDVIDNEKAKKYLSSYLMTRKSIKLEEKQLTVNNKNTSSEIDLGKRRRVIIPLSNKHNFPEIYKDVYFALEELELLNNLVGVEITKMRRY